MKLTDNQALELIKVPKNTSYIRLAQRQEARLLMHTEPLTEKDVFHSAVMEFLAWVKSFLPLDKYARFEQLLQFPLETVDSTETIFDELSKFFTAPDRDIKTKFTAPVYEQDFNEYSSKLGESFWEVKAFYALKAGINSFVIIDLPTSQRTLRPEPYHYILSIGSVHDVDINEETGDVEYIIFNTKNGRKVCLDELAYRVFFKPENEDWQLEFPASIHSTYQTFQNTDGSISYGEVLDGVGYTPACSFYNNSIKGSKGINKKGPLTNALSKLDWLLFFKTSKKYLDLYGSWPIVVSYKDKCNYRDENNNECNEGYVNYTTENSLGATTACQKVCPACQKRGLIGAGSHLKVDPPSSKDDVDLMVNPMKFMEISNDKLEYGVSEIERLEREIFVNTVGFYQEATAEAQNAKQVQSQFESQKSILDSIRGQFERCIKFTNQTEAKLRYGRAFLSATAFLGKEYFLQTSQDLMLQYSDAKKSGLPSYEVARLREAFSKTKYRNNQTEYQRSFILSQLEPYPDYSATELVSLGITTTDPLNFALKLDFSNYIAKFERENLNIVEFGSLINLSDKILIIQTKLLDYVKARFKETQASTQLIPGADGGSSDGATGRGGGKN